MIKKFIEFVDYAPEGVNLANLGKSSVEVEELLNSEALNFDISDHPETIKFIEENSNKDLPVWAMDNIGNQAFAFESLKEDKDSDK